MKKELIKNVLPPVLMFIVVGIAGRYERKGDICFNLNKQVYDLIVEKLGGESKCTFVDIADEYERNKSYYDSIPDE